MKTLALLILTSLVTGCIAGTQPKPTASQAKMQARLDRQDREIATLRRGRVLLQRQKNAPTSGMTSATPVQPTVPQARPWASHVCDVDYNSDKTLANQVKFGNIIDRNSKKKKNWVAITLNGQPVPIKRSAIWGPKTEYFLAPDETCFFRVGGFDAYGRVTTVDNVKVVGTLYQNVGTYDVPVLINKHTKKTISWDVGSNDGVVPVFFQHFHF